MVSVDKLASDIPVDANSVNGDRLIVVKDLGGGSYDTKTTNVEDVLRIGTARIEANANVAGQTLTTGAWAKVTQFDTSVAGQGVVADHANNRIRGTLTGFYLVLAELEFDGTASAAYDMAIYWNGVAFSPTRVRTLDASNTRQAIVLMAFGNANVLDKDFELWARSPTAGNPTFRLLDGSLQVARLA